MILLSETLSQLESELVALRTCAIDDEWRPWYKGADEAYENFELSLKHLRKKLGDKKYLKLLNMMETARKHFEEGYAKGGRPGQPGDNDIKRGSWLMQDMGQVIRDKPPFAYPHDEWRWGEPLPIEIDDLTADDVGLE
ncbi:hypothetical protein [Sphingorhabdus sp.]|jgi:hypothetical protein|uniref:hypothetical protein n=1 Tax=Sphingorhabdus sp. TaxID=1902408 RepID=UPI0035ADF9F3|nr:hypothetical protein [Sphingomonadaceae bacterium]